MPVLSTWHPLNVLSARHPIPSLPCLSLLPVCVYTCSDSQLSSVMELGMGGSAALSVLYMEVCARLGMHLAARPLEDGR